MEIRELAERALFGPSLEEKLRPASRLSDDHPGPPQPAPVAPGRPAALRFSNRGEGGRFPRPRELESEAKRAQLLHFFANHELLATELMALVLLRFPEAPKAFRRGVAKTLMEEQQHTRLYLERMEQLGCQFGELPLSGFFWNALSGMESPLAYVTGLPLTFEQANLDFSIHFAGLFAELGDVESEKLMRRIYQDELGHVAYGLKWLRHLKKAEMSDWEAYRSHLRMPLSPRRARGTTFNVEGRRRSGFDEHFIRSLTVYSKSRGRSPDVYVMNVYGEWEWLRREGLTLTQRQEAMQHDLQCLPQFFGSDDDVLLVTRSPRKEWLQQLKKVGLPVPEFEPLRGLDQGIRANSELLERRLGHLRPWAWSPMTARLLTPISSRSRDRSSPVASPARLEALAPLFKKSFGCQWLRRWLEENPTLMGLRPASESGRVGDTPTQIQSALEAWRAKGLKRFVVKADWGAAGGRMIRLWEDQIKASQWRWMEKRFHQGERLVVEPWYDRRFDFSVHFDMEKGQARLRGFVRLVNDPRGQFVGCAIGSSLPLGCEEGVRRCLHGDSGNRYKTLCQTLGNRLAGEAARVGYEGPVGVDAFVYQDQEGELRINPAVEINPRYTMGRLTLALRRYATPGRVVAMTLFSRVQLKALKLENFQELAGWLSARFPLEMEPRSGGKIRNGAVCLTDPQTAIQCVAVLLVGRAGYDWLIDPPRGPESSAERSTAPGGKVQAAG